MRFDYDKSLTSIECKISIFAKTFLEPSTLLKFYTFRHSNEISNKTSKVSGYFSKISKVIKRVFFYEYQQEFSDNFPNIAKVFQSFQTSLKCFRLIPEDLRRFDYIPYKF